jgi:hypothetical protein
MSKDTHVILVAFTVASPTRQEAESYLRPKLPPVEAFGDDGAEIQNWWIAEDDRKFGSDNDSAVFVTKGLQHEASMHLFAEGLTPLCNIVDREARV